MKTAVTLRGMKLLSPPEEPVRQYFLKGDIGEITFTENSFLKQAQEFVGGYIEAVDLPSLEVTMWCHEESKLVAYPIKNLDATDLYVAEYGNHDWIAGDVLFTNIDTDKYGNTLGLTQAQKERLLAKLIVLQASRADTGYFIPVLNQL